MVDIGDPAAPPPLIATSQEKIDMPSSRSRTRRPTEGRVLRPTEQLPAVQIVEAVVTEVEGESSPLGEAPWLLSDRLFWETVDSMGMPPISHRIDMVLSQDDGDGGMRTQVFTMHVGTD